MFNVMPSIAAAVLLVTLTACGQDSFTLQQNLPVTIMLADSHSSAEQTAAEELKTYLSKMIGAQCEITPEAHTTEPVIYVGPTAFAREHGIDCSTLGREEWMLRAVGESLIVAGGRPRGTIYAAYEMLERLGVVWPDVHTESVPDIVSQRINWNLGGRPAIMNRCIYSGIVSSPQTIRFFVRNRMNSQVWIPENLGGCELNGRPKGCHTFHAYTTPEWPDEWFAMNKNGQRVRSRSGSGPSQFCLTSPDVRRAVCQKLRAFIQRDRKDKAGSPELYPRIYDISHNDCHGECYCPDCSAVCEREGAYSGVMLDFINFVARDIAEDYPEILIQTFAYTFTLDAPRHIKPEPNVLIRVCKLGCEFSGDGQADTQFPNTHPRNRNYYDNFRQWADISPNLAVWDYWIIYTKPYQQPYLNARHIQADMAFYRDHNVKTLFAECEAPTSTSFFPFKVWFGLKMMVDPAQSYDALALRFCRAQYAAAAQPMLKVINLLQEREKAADIALGTINPNETPYLDRDFFRSVNTLFDEAERLAANHPGALLNIARERVPVDAALLNLSQLYPDALPAGGNPPCDLKALFERYATNSLIQANHFYNSEAYAHSPDKFNGAVVRIATKKTRFTGAPSDYLPPQFTGKEVVDINWSALSFSFGKNIVDDPDGLAGKAALLPSGASQEDYHRLPFNMGLYNKGQKKILINKNIPVKEIPQDGKFHLYPLGKHTIEPKSIFWAHWTWLFAVPIDTVYLAGQNNDWEVYASVKLVGAPYQREGKEPAGVFVDRVLLVR